MAASSCNSDEVARVKEQDTSLRTWDGSNGLWRSLVSALDWGSRGREFKSPQPDAKPQVRGSVGRPGVPLRRLRENWHECACSHGGVMSPRIQGVYRDNGGQWYFKVTIGKDLFT